MAELPDSVEREAKNVILAEDVMLDIVRKRLPGLQVTSWIDQDMVPPYVLFREAPFVGQLASDSRFLEEFYVTGECFTQIPDGDIDAPRILTAIGTAIERAGYAHDEILDGLGWVQSARLIEPPNRRADFANSEGPVQYADLPQGYARFISTYHILVKRSNVGPNVYNF